MAQSSSIVNSPFTKFIVLWFRLNGDPIVEIESTSSMNVYYKAKELCMECFMDVTSPTIQTEVLSKFLHHNLYAVVNILIDAKGSFRWTVSRGTLVHALSLYELDDANCRLTLEALLRMVQRTEDIEDRFFELEDARQWLLHFCRVNRYSKLVCDLIRSYPPGPQFEFALTSTLNRAAKLGETVLLELMARYFHWHNYYPYVFKIIAASENFETFEFLIETGIVPSEPYLMNEINAILTLTKLKLSQ